eukprot:scaffold84408_cov33-Tisochrysis_lutea.AAC.4
MFTSSPLARSPRQVWPNGRRSADDRHCRHRHRASGPLRRGHYARQGNPQERACLHLVLLQSTWHGLFYPYHLSPCYTLGVSHGGPLGKVRRRWWCWMLGRVACADRY